MTMTNTTDRKPRFTRVVKDGKMWLRDREGFKMVGPFDSWAEAEGHIASVSRGEEQDKT